MSKFKKTDRLSASNVGRAAFCPHYLELQEKGAAVSKSAQAARRKGDVEHDNLNRLVEDSRCFIATHLYGIDDPRTQLLRRYRDIHLSKSMRGRLFIEIYYRASPSLVCLAKLYPAFDGCIQKIVDRIVANIKMSHTP